MKSDRATGAVVGILFITATVLSVLGSAALGSALDGSEYLEDLADYQNRVIAAVLLFVIAASSAFATAVLLFPILRRHAEALAVGYVGLRGFENVLYVAGSVMLLVMVSVSGSDAAAASEASALSLVGVSLQATQQWLVSVGTLIFFGLGALTLNAVLYRARLVPRWLSAWGLVGAVLVVTYGLLGILGWSTALGSPLMLLAMPIALQELVFAGWLVIKGFAPGPVRTRPEQLPRVDATA
jgi:hypothetical protein